MSEVVAMTNRMSDTDYEAERATIADKFGGSKGEAGARFEQELARLYERSGWTERELAERESKSPGAVHRLVVFGNFLSASQWEASLTERRFRSCWSMTNDDDGDQPERFEIVTELLDEPNFGLALGKALQGDKLLLDGKWRSESQIVQRLVKEVGASERQTTKFLNGRIKSGPTIRPLKTERKKVGTGFDYRFFVTERNIPVIEIAEKLGPLLDRLEEQGRKYQTTISTTTVALVCKQIQNVVKEWTQ